MEARELIETWFDRLWRRRDASVIERMRDDGAASHGLGDRPMSNADFRAMHARFCEIFETIDVTIERFVEQGDQVAMTLRFRGMTKRGTRVAVRGAAFARVVDGRITESENLWDIAGMLEQLGAENGPRATTLVATADVLAEH